MRALCELSRNQGVSVLPCAKSELDALVIGRHQGVVALLDQAAGAEAGGGTTVRSARSPCRSGLKSWNKEKDESAVKPDRPHPLNILHGTTPPGPGLLRTCGLRLRGRPMPLPTLASSPIPPDQSTPCKPRRRPPPVPIRSPNRGPPSVGADPGSVVHDRPEGRLGGGALPSFSCTGEWRRAGDGGGGRGQPVRRSLRAPPARVRGGALVVSCLLHLFCPRSFFIFLH